MNALYLCADCVQLVCTSWINGHRLSTGQPIEDYTPCGSNGNLRKMCYNGRCVDPQRFESVDGNWSIWSQFGPCSMSCGGGIRYRSRYCNSPAPMNGGQYCEGADMEYESCNTMDCPPGSKTPR